MVYPGNTSPQVHDQRFWPVPMREEPDRQSVFSNSSSTISRPTRAFFLGCRESQILDIRSLEEGHGQGPPAGTSSIAPTPAPGSAPPPPRSPPGDEEDLLPLPPKRGSRVYRYLRWNFGSVYRRIFTLAFLVNFLVLFILIGRSAAGGPRFTHKDASIAVSANLFVALLIRNEHVVNIMFIVFGTWPKNLPLRFRRLF
ncbi:hypothetical protein MAPG_09556, partial [Magnaporthiopsis poae ATCC 64411]